MSSLRRASAALGLAALLLQTMACGSAPPPGPAQPIKSKTAPAKAKAIPDGQIDRRVLELALMEGPGWLLERVPIEEVLEKGKFVGWRVQELPDSWVDAELRPGDIVTQVNGMALETPNDFWAVWTTLSVASELKVAYRRGGEEQELSMPIHGSPDPQLAARIGASSGKQGQQGSKTITGGKPSTPSASPEPVGGKPRPEGKRKPTIVITPPAPPPGNTY